MMQPGVRVRVTNGNRFAIEDRYDGVPEVFAPGASVTIELAAAAHIFGFPVDEHGTVVGIEPDKAYVCRRWGWNLPTFGIEKSPEGKQVINAELAQVNADKAFKLLKVEAVTFDLVERPVSDDGDTLPASRSSAMKGHEAPTGRPRKQRKPMSPERLEQLRANLAKGRETRRNKPPVETASPADAEALA